MKLIRPAVSSHRRLDKDKDGHCSGSKGIVDHCVAVELDELARIMAELQQWTTGPDQEGPDEVVR
jgi:hypothetical protein